jgi:hypothetical protein
LRTHVEDEKLVPAREVMREVNVNIFIDVIMMLPPEVQNYENTVPVFSIVLPYFFVRPTS